MLNSKIEKKYDFLSIEKNQLNQWKNDSTYEFIKSDFDTFVIDTPPPTISGLLHMGHIFSYTHTDFIARYQRMKGRNVFYPMGFDNNGLPTERLIEKMYNTRASSEKSFLDMCDYVSSEKINEFKSLFNRVALSVDWNLEYNTNSHEVRRISQSSFIDLYKKGYIYHKMMPTIWDTLDKTAISQAEIEEKIFKSKMYYIEFRLEDNNKIYIATTRPELIPACVALLFNPDDNRYNNFLGKNAIVPLCDKKVPIIADPDVKIEKGTGLVMCCSFGDELDLKWINRHHFDYVTIINHDGRLYNLDKVGLDEKIGLDGLYVKDARKKIIEILSEMHLITKQEDIEHCVKCAERSGAQLEIIPTKQWYISILQHKEVLISYANKCKWVPERMKIKIEQWINGLSWDWCISRQRYLGIPIPAWHNSKTGNIILPEISSLPINPKTELPEGYKKDDVIPDENVMDTWATSSLTPQILAYGIDFENSTKKDMFYNIFPSDLRPQAHEIIRTWAFYTIVKSYFHNNSIPWKNIMISGWCLADDRTKMSKSKGNIVSPQSLLDLYGSDVVRYWASTAQLGADTSLSDNTMKMGKKLMNKIWSCAGFIESFLIKDFHFENIVNFVDLWIISSLSNVIKKIEDEFDNFNYCEARDLIENFFLREYCDYYLELVKNRAYSNDISAINTLNITFNYILKLFAPFFPYITDEIYKHFYSCESIHKRGSWVKKIICSDKINLGRICMQIIDRVREYKSSKNVSIKYELHIVNITVDLPEVQEMQDDIKSCCNINQIFWIVDNKLNGQVLVNVQSLE